MQYPTHHIAQITALCRQYVTRLLILSVVIPFNIPAQNAFDKVFVQQKSSNGLLGNSIKTITQDNWGFLWVGTENGVYQFDGYSYRALQTGDSKFDHSPFGNYVKKIFFDSSFRLWIGTSKGACIYNYSSYDIQYLNVFDNVFVHTFKEDKNKNIWVGSERGLSVISHDTKKVRTVSADECPEMVGKRVNLMSKDVYGNLWCFSEYGLHKITILEDGKPVDAFDFSRRQTISCESFSVKGRIALFYIDKQNQAWIGIDNDVYRLSFSEKTPDLKNAQLVCSNEESLCIHQDPQGNIWVGTRNQGIICFRLDREGKILAKEKYWINPNVKHNISNTVNNIFSDKWGNMWVGTENGLFMEKNINKGNFYPVKDTDAENAISENIISGIYEDSKKNIWLCTANGLDKFNWTNKAEKQFVINKYSDRRSPEKILPNNRFQSMIEEKEDIFWLSTKDNMVCFDAKTGTFFQDPRMQDFLKDNNLKLVRMFYRDKQNNIWIGSSTSAAVYVSSKDKFFMLSDIDKDLKNEDYWAITEDTRGYLWIGTRKSGLYKLKVNVNAVGNTDNKPVVSSKKHFLPDEWITAICIDKDNIPWVGTSNKLFRYDPESETFKRMILSSRPDENIYITGILEDHNDDLWVSTINEFYRYNARKNTCEYYDLHNGNLSRVNYLFGQKIAADGTVFLGGINGLTFFSPEEIRTDTLSQNIYITDFQVLNKRATPPENTKILSRNINLTESITLSHTDYQFLFEFSILYFTDPYKIMYSYQLEGFDKDRIYVDARHNYASYSNLPPGDYTLRIRSTNASGIWLNNERVLKIKILPPPWATWWAYCIYFVLFVLIVGFGIYIIYVRSSYKQQEKINRWKTNFYGNIIHGLEAPLFLLRAPAEDLISNIKTLTKPEIENMLKIMSQNIKRLSQLTKQLVEFQKLELGQTSLSYSKFDLIPFIQNIYDLFLGIAEPKSIRFEYEPGSSTLPICADSEKLEVILFNLLSNAFKSTTENGLVVIRCYENIENREIWIEVYDNGIGPAKKYQRDVSQRLYSGYSEYSSSLSSESGLGLTLAKDFIKLHHGKLFVESIPGKGSTFRFFVPLHRDMMKKNMHDSEIKEISPDHKSYIESFIEIEKSLNVEASDKKTASGNTSVFIIDKNADLSTFLEKVIAKHGYRVKRFHSDEHILQSAITLDPSLILIGLENDKSQKLLLCKKIKDNLQTCHIPVILLIEAGAEEEESKIEGYEFGADACIAQPFDVSYLLIRIKHLINIRKSMREKLQMEEFIHSKEEKSAITSIDDKFIKKVMKVVEKNIADEQFNLDEFARQTGTSRSVLNTKIQSLFGQAPIEFVKTIRLKKAAQLLESEAYSITEISTMVGFSDSGYFSTCFKKQFGVKPSEYKGLQVGPKQ